MNCYQVTWGPEVRVVHAEDENTAWAKFCDGCDVARKTPQLYERSVKEIDPAKASATKKERKSKPEPKGK